jgi:manganese efflux pump family protein
MRSLATLLLARCWLSVGWLSVGWLCLGFLTLGGLGLAIGTAGPAYASGLRSAAAAPSVGGCAQSAAASIERRQTLTSLPEPCRGLSPGGLHRAVSIAIGEFAGHGDKRERRHRAIIASARVRYLAAVASRGEARAAARAARARAARARRFPGASVGPAGLSINAGLAALISWLLTAASGGYLLVGWLSHGGMRRQRTSAAGLPPVVILSHFGLAASGLLVWIGYLLTSWTPAAWIAVGMLMPVVGLGISTLLLAAPDSGPAADVQVATAGSAALGRRGMPVVMIAAHGVLATLTVLLVLLAAVSAI